VPLNVIHVMPAEQPTKRLDKLNRNVLIEEASSARRVSCGLGEVTSTSWSGRRCTGGLLVQELGTVEACQ
jgi:hypothetical protein